MDLPIDFATLRLIWWALLGVLLIGFSLAADLPAATFHMAEDEAIGTMTLPASCLSAYILMANSPAAYFRMGGDGSLNTPMRNGEEGSGEWQDWLSDDGPLQDELVADAQESEVRHDMLVEAMDSLNDREKHILTERRLTENPQTLEELSQVYDVSRERIRQIEVRAFEKLQKAMKTIAGEKLLPGVA